MSTEQKKRPTIAELEASNADLRRKLTAPESEVAGLRAALQGARQFNGRPCYGLDRETDSAS
jgi:hypothetical protein